MEWLDVFRGHTHRPHDAMLAHSHAAQHGCVIRDSCPRTDLSLVIVHDHTVVQIMRVRIDVGVIGDGRAFVNDDLAAVIEQNVFVDGAVVLHRQVVAIRHFDTMKDFHILAAVLEDVPGQHRANPIPECMIHSNGRPVVHHPKPDQRLAFGVFRRVHVSVVFRLQRRVARIERMDERVLRPCGRGRGRLIRTSKIKLMQRVADGHTAPVHVTVGELGLEIIHPVLKSLFRSRQRFQNTIFITWHRSASGINKPKQHST